MPIYDYICDSCKLEVSIINPITESDKLPAEEEVAKATPAGAPPCTHNFRKTFKKAPMALPGPTWGGWQKGHWIALLGVLIQCL